MAKIPTGYVAWHEWADAQIRKGLRQFYCQETKLWEFPQEHRSHKYA